MIVLTDDQSCSAALERLLDMTDRRFRVAGLTSFYEYAFGWLPLDHLTPMWFLSLLHLRQRPGRRPSKRLFDVAVAAVGLLLTVPLLPLIAAARQADARPAHLPADARGRGRPALHDVQVPHDARGRGAAGRARVRPGQRPARVRRRPVPAPHASRRAAAALERAQGRHVDRRPAARAPGVRRDARGGHPVLEPAAADEARHDGWAQVRCGYASDCASAAEKLSYDFWYMRHGSLAVDIAVCIETALQALGIFDPRQLRIRRRRPAGGDAGG